jgi:hypothetical protein
MVLELRLAPAPAPDTVNCLMSRRLDDPRAREVRYAVGPPLTDGGRKCFLCSLFGEIEVADEANQRRDDPAPVGAIDRIDRRGGVRWHGRSYEFFWPDVDPGRRRSTH